MNRKEMIWLLEQKHCLRGGTQEACVKVRNYIVNAMPIGTTIQAPQACVRNDEFLEAVSVLLAYVCDKEDIVPERWHCENDCVSVSSFFCRGECKVRKDAPKLCPYYEEENK